MASATALNDLVSFVREMIVTAEDIFDMVYRVPSRDRSGAIFKISTARESDIKRLKDGNGRYLCSVTGTPQTLLGYPIEWDDNPDLLDTKAIQFVPATKHRVALTKTGSRCEYCGTKVTVGDKFCRDGCGAPY